MEFGLEKLSHFGFEIRALVSQSKRREISASAGNGNRAFWWERRRGGQEECPLEQGGGGGLAGRGSQGPAPWGGGRPGSCRAKLFRFQFVCALGQSHCLFKPAANICLVLPAPWGVEAGAVKGSPAFWDHPVVDASVSAVIY